MKLSATQNFTDKQGVEHKQGQTFECANEQEAQEYIRQGNARDANRESAERQK